MTEHWKQKWEPALASVGHDLSDGTIRWGADRIETGLLRRLIEPIEIDTLIHTDEAAAQAAGHPGIVVPAFGVLSFSIPASWRPGDPELFPDPTRNAQPARNPINNSDPGPAPRTKGFFATDVEMDHLRDVEVGELLGRCGRRLLSCEVKETSVGRGGFMTWESDIVSDRGDVVARLRIGTFAFDPILQGGVEEPPS